MDCVNRDYAAFSQTAQSGNDHVPAGRKGYGAIQFDGRFLSLVSDPGRTERFGQMAMRSPSRGNVYIAFPGAQNRDGKMRRRAETEQPDSLAMLYACDPKTAKTDDAGAQKRRGMQIVERLGKGKYEINTGGGIFGIASVHGVSSEGGGIAKVFHAMPAIPAVPVNAADPGNTNACPNRKLRGGPLDDVAHNLMTRNYSLAARWELALNNVQIGSADAAGAYA